MNRGVEVEMRWGTLAYAGIGSRTISEPERIMIQALAGLLARRDWVVYSGSADGADIAFQVGSKGRCVLLLPWPKFNRQNFGGEALAEFAVGKTAEGRASVAKYHPNPAALSEGGLSMMARNYHQIHGYDTWPRVRFVICCANETKGKIMGGTGQACRIAEELGLPLLNIRGKTYQECATWLKTNVKGIAA